MYLVQLVYTSVSTSSMELGDIEKILKVARDTNKDNDITGMLCFNKEIFLQVLEGSRNAVNSLYQRIATDKRHDQLVILGYQELYRRDFQDWSMGFIPPSLISAEMNLKYSGDRHFNPYEMTGESALQFLKELKSRL